MSQLANLLSKSIAPEKVNELFDIADKSDLKDLSPDQLNGLEQIICQMLILNKIPSSGAIINRPKMVNNILTRIRELQ
ncbi:hypothetical protein WAX88_21355 (plasmid) [Photobacterium damselae subsp. damselae]|uniref:hypothetical protein n=1 Tax=Photobacterium damselae TaxID=38293 RepID=UPI00311AE940